MPWDGIHVPGLGENTCSGIRLSIDRYLYLLALLIKHLHSVQPNIEQITPTLFDIDLQNSSFNQFAFFLFFSFLSGLV